MQSYNNMSIDELNSLQQHLENIKTNKRRGSNQILPVNMTNLSLRDPSFNQQIIQQSQSPQSVQTIQSIQTIQPVSPVQYNQDYAFNAPLNKPAKAPVNYCINTTDIAQNKNVDIRDTAVPIFGSTGLSRLKKTDNNYYNRYEHSAHDLTNQQEFGMLSRDLHLGPYGGNAQVSKMMGLNDRQFAEQYPNGTKNVGVETPMIYGETSRWPKQSGLSMIEKDRFDPLFFDPQDTRHIIRPDGYPQAGINTRLDRLEYV